MTTPARILAPDRKPGRSARRRRGFTLPEVLATLVFLGIALPAALRAVTLSVQAASSANHRAEASMIASAKMGEILAIGVTGTCGGTDPFDMNGISYSVTWDAKFDNTLENLYDITVQVIWNERNQTNSVVLSSCYYNTGIIPGGSAIGSGGSIGGSTSTGGIIK
jgi:prepilin-type N-terminal cleavage/methylation domain-containing protein